MENDVIKRLREIIEEQGLSEEAASLKCGLDRSYFRKLFERGNSSPRGNTLERIAAGLGITAASLFDSTPSASEVRPADVNLPSRSEMPNDIPVMGTAAGSHLRGAFQISTDYVDVVRRPPALTGVKSAYALYLEGTSMVPKYEPGDLLYVHPKKPVRAGDPCVVQCYYNGQEHEIEATVGMFLRYTPEMLVIRKYNPDSELSISRKTVKDVHRILTLNELFGV
jgi:phage repressor protein C with HTH and peptisase S24 domain